MKIDNSTKDSENAVWKHSHSTMDFNDRSVKVDNSTRDSENAVCKLAHGTRGFNHRSVKDDNPTRDSMLRLLKLESRIMPCIITCRMSNGIPLILGRGKNTWKKDQILHNKNLQNSWENFGPA